MSISIDINQLYEVLVNEILNSDFTKLDENFFNNIASYFKQNRNNNSSTSTINSVLNQEVKTIILSLIKKLIEIRSRKLFLNSTEKLTLSNLTLEERFLFNQIIKFKQKTETFLKNIEMGNKNKLDDMRKKVIKRTILVKVESNIPPFVGVDLKKYGPLEPEDIAILPSGSIEPFLNKLYISGGWAEDLENP
jgi:DNA replication initiation complex subunit (GINS family)